MEAGSIKQKATTGVLWNAIEKFSVLAGQFMIGIVLARILMPKDFGLIGMLSIFIVVSQSFVDSGMGLALVQKKDRTELDFSTVFVFNFLISTLFYFILFFAAPFIADFYEMPQLVGISRILTLNLIINSLAIVQRTRLVININFKTLAKINVISVVIAGSCGIICANLGYGVWSLVVQNLVLATVSVVLYWSLSKWKPSLKFSKKSFNDLFGFGSKLLLASIYGKILQNLYDLAIGKKFSAADLGYYNRSKSFVELSSGSITRILHQVTYPVLCSLADDKERMVAAYIRMIKMAGFMIFPVMTLLSLLADPLIRFVLTDKWAMAIPLLQWMCFARIIYPVSVINMNLLNAIGRSDLYLKVDLSKFPFILFFLVAAIPYGVKAMIIGQVFSAIIGFFINAYYPGKFYGYGAWAQIKDLSRMLLATAIMAVPVYFLTNSIEHHLLAIFTGGSCGLISYITACYFLKVNELNEIKSIGLKLLNKKKNQSDISDSASPDSNKSD